MDDEYEDLIKSLLGVDTITTPVAGDKDAALSLAQSLRQALVDFQRDYDGTMSREIMVGALVAILTRMLVESTLQDRESHAQLVAKTVSETLAAGFAVERRRALGILRN